MRRHRVIRALALLAVGLAASTVRAQINSGSDGHDGVLSPTSNLVIDMHDHPDGIYHYDSVNIPSGVTISFIPNTANTPVVWLVQQSCTIAGVVDASGKTGTAMVGGAGGPGGYRGGDPPRWSGNSNSAPGAGLGPGGGRVLAGITAYAGSGSHGTRGYTDSQFYPPGDTYGSSYLLPLLGGSGGSGGHNYMGDFGGGGGGGAILIAASGTLTVTGRVDCRGGTSNGWGYGSGGAVRLAATVLTGAGGYLQTDAEPYGGYGRVRLEAQTNSFTGSVSGVLSVGLAGIILIPSNQAPCLGISSVASVAVPAGAAGATGTPDVMIPGQQVNPVSIVVNCQNIPLNSDIIVEVKPTSGAVVTATGQNNTGTASSSTATVSLNLPPGEGFISARTTTNLLLSSARGSRQPGKKPSLFETGLAANGERFKAVELKSMVGGSQEVVYVTTSGKRFSVIAGRASTEQKASPTTRSVS